MWYLHEGDCIATMADMADEHEFFDSIVTDPPYGLSFMGKSWDHFETPGGSNGLKAGATGRAHSHGLEYNVPIDFYTWSREWATEAFRVLKPGGYLLAFGGTRTFHRLACAIEDAGFEIRDCIMYVYGTGFPKSMNVGCRCERTPQVPEHDLRQMSGTDLSSSLNIKEEQGEVLFPSMSQYGPSSLGTEGTESQASGSEQPGLEGRRDLEKTQGELQGSAIRSLSRTISSDGTEGRLHHGTSVSDGTMGGTFSGSHRGSESHQSQSLGQSPGEFGVISDERGSQTRGGWEVCPRCGKPLAGLGTSLKPAYEPIIVARKPLEGTVAANVLKYGTGGLNIDACRVAGTKDVPVSPRRADGHGIYGGLANDPGTGKGWDPTVGRWPANIILTHAEGCKQIGEGMAAGYQINRFTDGAKPFGNGAGHPYKSESTPEQAVDIYLCADGCPVAEMNRQSGHRKSGSVAAGGFSGPYKAEVYGQYARNEIREETVYADEGGASRYFNTFEPDAPFFYSAKASTKEREAGLDNQQLKLFGQSGGAQQALAEGKTEYQGEGGVGLNRIKQRKNNHPTVKPIALMRHLVRLVTPPGGTCLDPFVGSGTTGIACVQEGFNFVGIDENPEYLAIAAERIAYWETV